MLLTISYSCNRNKLERDDISVEYRNYLSPDTVNLDLSKLSYNIYCDSFDVNLQNKTKCTLLQGEALMYFFLKYDFYKYEYHKYMDAYGFYYDYVYKPHAIVKYNIYACGKIKIHDGIDGYVILFRNKLPLGGLYYNDLMLFTIKNKRLCSITELSHYKINTDAIENMIRTYKTSKDCFTHINYFGLTVNKAYGVNYADKNGWANIRTWSDFTTKLGVNNAENKILRYSMFYIDNIGFVRYIKTDTNNLPSILSEKSTWSSVYSLGPIM